MSVTRSLQLHSAVANPWPLLLLDGQHHLHVPLQRRDHHGEIVIH